MEVDEHVFLVHHVSNVRFLIIVGFPAGTNDVRRRRPRQTPLSRRNTRRCTRRPRTTSTHARLFQEAGPLIPLPSQGNHPLRCIQPATALQFDSHQSSLFGTFKETTIMNHVVGRKIKCIFFCYLSSISINVIQLLFEIRGSRML